jgi:hypothetical protein
MPTEILRSFSILFKDSIYVFPKIITLGTIHIESNMGGLVFIMDTASVLCKEKNYM